ncbi:SRPBCC domain-containing protein [Micromonospora sp. NBC_01412]|uniref:SRPBCC domain-containing protein n=1 Tax=Micromonospora sp. NBC_01412 TaxID=2903590 RepID=UPI0032448D34
MTASRRSTDPARIVRWFLPVSGELRLHGRHQFEGNAGGEVQRCDPPKSFSATWEFGGQVSWIEVRLTPEPDDRTRFTLEHVAHVDDVIWARFGPGAVGIGCDMGLLGLVTYLRAGGDDDAGRERTRLAESPRGNSAARCRGRRADCRPCRLDPSPTWWPCTAPVSR